MIVYVGAWESGEESAGEFMMSVEQIHQPIWHTCMEYTHSNLIKYMAVRIQNLIPGMKIVEINT